MEYFVLEPEVAGGLGVDTVLDTGTHPPRVTALHYEFDGWLGDDILESFPCYLVTERCGDLLRNMGFTGFTLADVKITVSEQFSELYPERSLPPFRWLKVDGEAGKDDFALSTDHRLMVSGEVLESLKTLNIENCDIERTTV